MNSLHSSCATSAELANKRHWSRAFFVSGHAQQGFTFWAVVGSEEVVAEESSGCVVAAVCMVSTGCVVRRCLNLKY